MPLDTSDLVDLDLWFYNLDNGRPDQVVQEELEAIASTEPAFIGTCEAIGYVFDPLPRLELVRDRSTPSRANIATWVRKDLAGDLEQRWLDLSTTWPRTDRPGTHEPRSFQRVLVGRIPVFTAHQPPPHVGTATAVGQQEGVDALTRAIAPWHRSDWTRRVPAEQEQARERPRVLLWDANRRPGDAGPGPTLLARQVHGRSVGHRIDGAVVSGVTRVSRVDYPEQVAGVPLGSDHHHAFRFTLSVHRRWVEPSSDRR
ncbi:hypothetical protein [Nocardioides sp. SR21]|uniref:hypothetical protein n=1 Tax=Nocardioides sp. SR21 TaxID=2919501 RepID=UPI001FA9E71D|nr:hypothetical protein [Nocardioides sp. SR21]